MSKKIETVSEYIMAAPAWARPMLRELCRVIHSAAPKAVESTSYQMPYYTQEGRVAYFGAYRDHCSFHWVSREDKRVLRDVLSRVKVSGSTLHIPRGERVPVRAIKQLVRAHMAHNLANQRKYIG